MSEMIPGAIQVPAGELAAFGLVLERAERALADSRAVLEAAREQVATEIEAEAATHLYSIRRAMRWAAWVARGKPAGSDPGNDAELSRAFLHGDAAKTAWACCPVETAAVTAERERIREQADGLKFTLWRPGNGPAQTQALEVVPLAGLLGILGGQS